MEEMSSKRLLWCLQICILLSVHRTQRLTNKKGI